MAVLAALIAFAALTGAAHGGSPAGNRRAARTDAARLVAALRLPATAARRATEPAGDHGYLKPTPALEGDRARVTAQVWWQLPGSPAAAIAYVRAHPPRGSRLAGTGTSGNQRTGTSAELIVLQWPPVPGELGSRELTVTATALPGGRTGVLAEAQSDWIVPRPAAEHIPGTTRLVQITSGAPSAPPTVSLAVTDPVRVQQIVAVINRLPIAQPITYACPLLTDPRVITMTFLAATGGRPLAVARYLDFRPWSGPSDGCKTVTLTIGGRSWPPLIGGRFLTTLDRLLHTTLASPPSAAGVA